MPNFTTELKFTNKFYATGSKIRVNQLSQKLSVKYWLNWLVVEMFVEKLGTICHNKSWKKKRKEKVKNEQKRRNNNPKRRATTDLKCKDSQVLT